MSTLDVFDIFSRDYARERFETMSLRDWLLAARDDKMLYATPSERMVAAIGEPELVDTAQDTRLAPHVLQPHHQDLSRLRRLLRDGRHDRAHRGLLQARRAGPRGEAADTLSAGPGRRRQVLARRAAQGSDGEASDLCAEGRRPDQPGVRNPARSVPLAGTGQSAGRTLRHRAPSRRRRHEPLGGEAAGRIRRRHLQIRGRASSILPSCARSRSPRPSRATRTTRTSPRSSARSISASSSISARTIPTPIPSRAGCAAPIRACWNSSRCSRRRSRCCTRC